MVNWILKFSLFFIFLGIFSVCGEKNENKISPGLEAKNSKDLTRKNKEIFEFNINKSEIKKRSKEIYENDFAALTKDNEIDFSKIFISSFLSKDCTDKDAKLIYSFIPFKKNLNRGIKIIYVVENPSGEFTVGNKGLGIFEYNRLLNDIKRFEYIFHCP
jgi:hypothetical protein